MKDNTFFKLFIIILIAVSFRLWCLDKPEGLWNDEYVSWNIASITDFKEFLNTAIQNCHAPFYYFYLKFWMSIFPDTDIILRWSSIVPSILSIPVMYYAGKELLNKKIGILAAFLTAISSFCIYFAQEIRLYSLIFLITALILLYFIRAAKVQSRTNLLIYFSLNALLCATHTLGIIFSFFNILMLLIYLYKNSEDCKNKLRKIFSVLKYIAPFLLVILAVSPFLIHIALSQNLSQFWSKFSYSKILCTFIDYYSPIQTNIQNTPKSFFSYIYNNASINYAFIIFAVIPLIIGVLVSIKAIFQKDKILNYITLSSAMFFITLIILSAAGKMILITKYSIEIYPLLLILTAYGFLSIKKRFLKNTLIVIFAGLQLFYLLNAQDSAPKRTRPEGHLAVVEMLNNSKLKQNDFVVLTYYGPEKFQRYLGKENQFRFYTINKFNFNYILFNGENYFDVIKYGKQEHKSFFEEFPSSVLKEYAESNFINEMKPGDRIGIVFLDNVSFISSRNMQIILNDEKKYENTPFIFLVFSSIKNNLISILKQEFTLDEIIKAGDWTLYVYVKTSNQAQ